MPFVYISKFTYDSAWFHQWYGDLLQNNELNNINIYLPVFKIKKCTYQNQSIGLKNNY